MRSACHSNSAFGVRVIRALRGVPVLSFIPTSFVLLPIPGSYHYLSQSPVLEYDFEYRHAQDGER